MNRNLGPVVAAAVALALALVAPPGCGDAPPPAGTPAPGTCEHRIADADCPFCHPDLVAKLGECKEHGVPEALCWTCKPSLEKAYKMKGDWCGEHGLPESRCKLCGK